jgi:hypothetical protein
MVLYVVVRLCASAIVVIAVNEAVKLVHEIQHFIIARALLKGYVKVGAWD